MGGFSVDILGLKELDAKLSEMSTEMSTKIVRKALRAGGKVMQEAIAEAAPVKADTARGGTSLPPGTLKSDIIVTLGRDDEGSPAAIVGPGKYTAHVANFVEYGHRQVTGGYSNIKNGKASGPGKSTGQVPAYPFIRPAYEATREASVEAMITSLRNGVEGNTAAESAA